jgi:hypothetical protein
MNYFYSTDPSVGPVIDMDNILKMLLGIVLRRIRTPDSKSNAPKMDVKLAEFLMEWIHNKRLYLVSDVQELGALWDSIRENENQVDFVVTTTREFIARLGIDQAWDDVVSIVVKSITTFQGDEEAKYTAMDADTLKLFPTHELAEALYRANPWFVVLQLIGMLDIEFLYADSDK